LTNIQGTTNELSRNKEPRKPLFLINKDFIKGLDIKQGICTETSLIPYSLKSLEGVIQQFKMNFVEIAIEAGTSKENAKTCLERIMRELIWKAKNV
jgi:hypothetical protein